MIKSLIKLFGGGSDNTTQTVENAPKSQNNELKDLENFVDYIARALVDKPGEVRIEVENSADNSTLKINCNKEDIGKIIGRRGKTIMAIRSLVSGAAGRLQQKVSVEVND